MHRLFAALPVPDSIASRLLPLCDDLHGARWRRREHYHITLCFYGEVSGEIAEELSRGLESLVAPALNLQISGVGWFGRREPRALYARICDDPDLANLAAACRKLARRLDLKLSQDPYLPHITLAYCKDTPLDQVRQWSEQFQILQTEAFTLDEFHLYESFTRHRKTSQYVAQADYRLGGMVV